MYQDHQNYNMTAIREKSDAPTLILTLLILILSYLASLFESI